MDSKIGAASIHRKVMDRFRRLQQLLKVGTISPDGIRRPASRQVGKEVVNQGAEIVHRGSLLTVKPSGVTSRKKQER
jgi:hypothetical protein